MRELKWVDRYLISDNQHRTTKFKTLLPTNLWRNDQGVYIPKLKGKRMVCIMDTSGCWIHPVNHGRRVQSLGRQIQNRPIRCILDGDWYQGKLYVFDILTKGPISTREGPVPFDQKGYADRFKELIDTVRLIDSPYIILKAVYPSWVQSYFKNNRFNVPMPIALSSKTMHSIHEHPEDWVFAPKLDGERGLIVMDPDFGCSITDRRGVMQPLELTHLPTRCILDGEWYHGILHAFDILVVNVRVNKTINGKKRPILEICDMTTKSYEDRYATLINVIQSIQSDKIVLKQVFPLLKLVDFAVPMNTRTWNGMEMDGLIFMPKAATYYSSPVKWKQFHTIDVIVSRDMITSLNIVPGHVYSFTEKKNIFFTNVYIGAKLQADILTQGERDSVIECVYTKDKQWVGERLRRDKHQANAMTTVEDTMRIIRENIDSDVLIQAFEGLTSTYKPLVSTSGLALQLLLEKMKLTCHLETGFISLLHTTTTDAKDNLFYIGFPPTSHVGLICTTSDQHEYSVQLPTDIGNIPIAIMSLIRRWLNDSGFQPWLSYIQVLKELE